MKFDPDPVSVCSAASQEVGSSFTVNTIMLTVGGFIDHMKRGRLSRKTFKQALSHSILTHLHAHKAQHGTHAHLQSHDTDPLAPHTDAQLHVVNNFLCGLCD